MRIPSWPLAAALVLTLPGCGGGGGGGGGGGSKPPPELSRVVGTYTATVASVSGSFYPWSPGATASFEIQPDGDVIWNGGGPLVRLRPWSGDPTYTFTGSRAVNGHREEWTLQTFATTWRLSWDLDTGDSVRWDVVQVASNG